MGLKDAKRYLEWRRELAAIGPHLDHLEWAVGEIERLQAIVAKLPKTEDGVPVVVGMDVWAVWEGMVFRWKVMRMDIDGWCWLKRIEPCDSPGSPEHGTKVFYSTPEAAEAGKAGKE